MDGGGSESRFAMDKASICSVSPGVRLVGSQAGCGDSAISALLAHAARAPQPIRDALALEFDGTGRVLAFQEPMLVVRLEHLSDDGASSVR